MCTREGEKGNIHAHSFTHTGVRRFKCTRCPPTKLFAYSHGLKLHILAVHDKHSWSCTYVSDPTEAKCNEIFSDPINVKKHIQAIHLHTTYPCPKPGCTTSCSLKQSLKRHIKWHEGDEDRRLLRQLAKDIKEAAAERARTVAPPEVEQVVAVTSVAPGVPLSIVMAPVRPTGLVTLGLIAEFMDIPAIVGSLPHGDIDNHYDMLGVNPHAYCVITCPSPFTGTDISLCIGKPLSVIHFTSNAINKKYGLNFKGTKQCLTMDVFESAFVEGNVTDGHMTVEASCLITPPWCCPPVVNDEEWRPYINMAVRATVCSGCRVVAVYGSQAKNCWTHERLAAIGIKRGPWRSRAGLKVYEVTRVKTGQQVAVVESKHPSDPEQRRHAEAYKAVAFTNVLGKMGHEDAAEAVAKVIGDRVTRGQVSVPWAGRK